jgi:uncharacterized protein YcbX
MISALHYFPIASCPGINKPAAAAYDKQWLVVDEAGRWLTTKDNPKLAEVEVDVLFGYLVMRAPGMLRMDLPLDVLEDDDSVRRQATVGKQRIDVVDEGDLAAAWLSNFLAAPSRLVKVHPDSVPVVWPDLAPTAV